MSESLRDRIKADLLPIIRADYPEAVAVTDWYESSFSIAGCDTCGYGSGMDVTVYWVDAAGKQRTWDHDGGFAELFAACRRITRRPGASSLT